MTTSPVRDVLLAPRMVLLHVLVLAVVLVLGRLGVWQLDRLEQAQARTATEQERLAAPPAPIGSLLEDTTLADTAALARLEFRPVTATGTWRPADEVLQRGRSLNGRAGFHVLTPLDLEDGGTVLVRRGWVPFDNELVPPVEDALPPSGTVTVQGHLERSIPQPTGGLAQRDPPDGELDVVFNADLARLEGQLGGDVLPMLVLLTEQSPAQDGELPVPAAAPTGTDDSPHLSYAIQWFSFAVLAALFYGIWLRRRVRRDERAISSDRAAS